MNCSMFRRLLLTSLPHSSNLPFQTRNLSLLPKLNPISSKMGDTRRPLSIPSIDKADRSELLRALESSLGSSFSSQPLLPNPNPLIIVISGPSGVGKDALITRLRLSRHSLHFVVTATTRPMRPGEVDGQDYHFVTKDEFLSMVERDELLEYALVYGDYKGVPKQQIRECMAKGYDIVLRVDIQGANTLKKVLGKSAVFVFLLAESEMAMVERLVDRKTETAESLLVRIATAREETSNPNPCSLVSVYCAAIVGTQIVFTPDLAISSTPLLVVGPRSFLRAAYDSSWSSSLFDHTHWRRCFLWFNIRLRIKVVSVDVFGQGRIPMFGVQGRWLRFSERFRFLQTRSLCSSSNTTNNPKTTSTTSTNPPKKNDINTDERYRQLEDLDMITAAKMLFTDPPKKKKFGLDFHLVQLFFACLPSLAVYLVAQYARYDIRKMEAEVEQKRKKRDEEEAMKEEEEAKEKEKEMDLNPPEEKEAKSDPQLSEVKMRLEKLEEALKEIVVETKKQSNTNLAKNQVTDAEKKQLNSSAPSDTSNSAASNKAVEGGRFGKHNSLKPKPELGEERKGSIATPNSSLQDPNDQHQGGGAS